MVSRLTEYPDCLNCGKREGFKCQYCFERLFYHAVLIKGDDCFDSPFIQETLEGKT